MTSTPGSLSYAQWVEEWAIRGYDVYIITFMFEQLRGSSESIQTQMLRIVEQAYATYLPRVVRRPLSPAARFQRPLWMVAPDLPVFKRERQRLRDIVVNGGLHIQGLSLEPLSRREARLIDELFFERRALFRQRCPELATIRLDRVTHDVERVVDYAFKHIARGNISEDHILILPRTVTEMRNTPDRLGRQSSIFGQASHIQCTQKIQRLDFRWRKGRP